MERLRVFRHKCAMRHKNEPETSFSDFINIYQQQVHILNCIWQDSNRSLNSTYKTANKSCILTVSLK